MPALTTARKNAVILVVLLFVQLVLMSSSASSGGSTVLESWVMRFSSPGTAGLESCGESGSSRRIEASVSQLPGRNFKVQELLTALHHRVPAQQSRNHVAQSCTLLYRRLAVCSVSLSNRRVSRYRLPTASRRYSRLKICATCGTAAEDTLKKRGILLTVSRIGRIPLCGHACWAGRSIRVIRTIRG